MKNGVTRCLNLLKVPEVKFGFDLKNVLILGGTGSLDPVFQKMSEILRTSNKAYRPKV